MATSELIASFEDQAAHVHALRFSPDGQRLLAGTAGMNLLRWKVDTHEVETPLKTGEVFAIGYSHDGNKFALAHQQSIRFWNAARSKYEGLICGHTGEVRALAMSPVEPLPASGAQDGKVKLWAVPTQSELEKAQGTYWVGFGKAKSQLYRLGRDRIDVWDPTTRMLTATLDQEMRNPTAIAISLDGTLLAVSQKEGGIDIWDLETSMKRKLDNDPGMTALAFSPDGRLLAAGCPRPANDPRHSDVKVWDLSSGELVCTLSKNEWTVGELAFSPDSTQLAVASWYEYANIPCKVHIWDVPNQRRLTDLVGHTKSVTAVEYSPDGRLIASSSWGRSVKLWDARTLALVATLEGHADRVSCLKFAPKSARLFTGDQSGTIVIWDLLSQQDVARLKAHTASIRSLAISADEDVLISASSGNPNDSGEITVWPARQPE